MNHKRRKAFFKESAKLLSNNKADSSVLTHKRNRDDGEKDNCELKSLENSPILKKEKCTLDKGASSAEISVAVSAGQNISVTATATATSTSTATATATSTSPASAFSKPTLNAVAYVSATVTSSPTRATFVAMPADREHTEMMIPQMRTSPSLVLSRTDERLSISVLVAGKIRPKTLEIWKTNVKQNRKLILIDLTPVTHMTPSAAEIVRRKGILVVDKNMTKARVLKTLKWKEIPAELLVISPQFMYDCFTQVRVVDVRNYRHALLDDMSVEAAKSVAATAVSILPLSSSSSSSSNSSSASVTNCTGGGEGSVRADLTTSWAMRPENKAKLLCQVSGTDTAQNHNSHLTKHLEDIIAYLSAQKGNKAGAQQYKMKIYTQGVGILKKLDKKITSVEHLNSIKNSEGKNPLGQSIVETLTDVITKGYSSKVLDYMNAPGMKQVELLSRIHGVGFATAQQMYNAGMNNIFDVRIRVTKGDYKFNHAQLVGIKHYEDFQVKIPRLEVGRMEVFVREQVQALVPGAEVYAVGSYRRGKEYTGDMDILIAPPPGEEYIDVIDALLVKLTHIGFLTDHLSGFEKAITEDGVPIVVSPRATTIEDSKRTYMGVCKELDREDAIFRRIDIKVFPRSSIAFSLLHFTGCDYFNRSIRWYCHTWCHNGFTEHTLSEDGLFPCTREKDHNGKIIVTKIADSVVCNTEREIFEVLGLKWKEPHERGGYHNEAKNQDDSLFTDKAQKLHLFLKNEEEEDDDEYDEHASEGGYETE